MRSAAPLLLLLTAQTPPDTLTYAQASAMPPESLARHVLGAAGVLVREARPSRAEGPVANRASLAAITFASAPRSAGFPGLCEVDTYLAGFAPAADPGVFDPNADLPSRVVALDRSKLFRGVDAGPAPARGWDDAYGKAMDAACAKTGPVLRTDRSSGFFTMVVDSMPTLRGASAITALGVIAASARSAIVPICQTSLSGPCATLIDDLARRPPNEVRSGPCAASARTCIEVRYDQGWLHWLTLTIESDVQRGPVAYDTPRAPIRAIRLDEVRAIE